jgi:N-acyl-D-amino-acid deacylase
MRRTLAAAVPIVLFGVLPGAAFRGEVRADAARTAIEKGLRRIERGAASYIGKRKCFSCHHQALAIMSMASARQRGFKLEADKLQQQIDFTLNTFKPKKARIAKGQGVEGASTMAVYALFALEQGRHPTDETTAALVDYLLVRQQRDGSWKAIARRPPQEGSSFTNTALAIRALRKYGPGKEAKATDARPARIEEAVRKGAAWLRDNEPETTEDMVFHLRGLVSAGAGKKEIVAARTRLLKAQRKDGSWAQLASLDGDAYATGSAMMSLRAAGLAASDPAYEKALKFLLATQKEDGSWIVTTRSRPVQVFFDNGDPGGKSQFISFAATGWAVLALLEQFPVK